LCVCLWSLTVNKGNALYMTMLCLFFVFCSLFTATIECRLARVSTVIISVFLVCWTPYVVTRTMTVIGLSLSSGVLSAAAWSVHASSFVNPFIYSSLRADLRRAMFTSVCSRCYGAETRPYPLNSTADGLTTNNEGHEVKITTSTWLFSRKGRPKKSEPGGGVRRNQVN